MEPGATVLGGDLEAFAVFEVLAFLAASGQTGVVEFRFERDVVKTVHLDRGEIVFATSSDAADRLGESLARAGQITPAQLEIASRAITPTNRLGKILVEMGALTPRALYDAVRRQVEEIVETLFRFERGRFGFTLGLPEGGTRIRISSPTRDFVLAAVGRTEAAPEAAAPPAPLEPVELAPLVARYDRALSVIAAAMRERGLDPEARLAEFTAGGSSPRVRLFEGIRLGSDEGLDVERLVANATGPRGGPALGESPRAYLEAGLEEIFAYGLFALQDLVRSDEAEALAAQIRAIFGAGDAPGGD